MLLYHLRRILIMKKTVSIILPCYKEEASLPLYFKAVDEAIKNIRNQYDFTFILVNDGSTDKTLEVMEKLYEERDDITYLSFSRNYGQNAALSAGLDACTSDFAITMDVDLQDPVMLIPEMLHALDEEGYDLVNPHRADRKSDSFFKRTTAAAFYNAINKLEGREVLPRNVNAFRGFNRRAYEAVKALPEKDRFVINEISAVGFRAKTIDIVRGERSAGESKYTVKKMFDYAFSLLSSGTSKPLYTPLIASLCFLAFSSFAFLAFLVFFLLGNVGISAFSLSWVSPCFILTGVFLGLSLLGSLLGIYGIYLHNILINTRQRPTYVIALKKERSEKNRAK